MAEVCYSCYIASLLSIEFSDKLLSATASPVTNFKHEDIVGSVDHSGHRKSILTF